MIKRLFKKPFSFLKQFYRNLFLGRQVEAIFDKNCSVASLSTLQKVNSVGQEYDIFYVQTRIRLCAHIVEKSLRISAKRSRYQQFVCELAERLRNYRGPNIVSIGSARNILQKYEDKYGL